MAKHLAYSQAPLFVRLKEALREHCLSLNPGDKLPSEVEIERTYEVSRTTVRLALGALISEGLVVSRQGKGSFVAEPRRSVTSFRGLIEGQEPQHATVLNIEATQLDAARAEPLGLQAGDHAHRVRRHLLANGEPVCYQVSYVPAGRFNETDVATAAAGDPVRLAEGPISVTQTVEVLLADAYRADQLGVPLGTPLLLTEGVVHDGDTPVELVRSFYSGHSVRLRLQERGPLRLETLHEKEALA